MVFLASVSLSLSVVVVWDTNNNIHTSNFFIIPTDFVCAIACVLLLLLLLILCSGPYQSVRCAHNNKDPAFLEFGKVNNKEN